MGYKTELFIKNNAIDLDSSKTGICDLYKCKTGSSCCLRNLQKCTLCVLDLENLKPLFVAQFLIVSVGGVQSYPCFWEMKIISFICAL